MKDGIFGKRLRRRKSHKTLDRERCDKKWAAIIKHRAGQRSEYSGKSGPLHAHHLEGKLNFRLRYELENGVAITPGEHLFIAHKAGKEEEFRKVIYGKRRANLRQWLEHLKYQSGMTKLRDVEFLLDQIIKQEKIKV